MLADCSFERLHTVYSITGTSLPEIEYEYATSSRTCQAPQDTTCGFVPRVRIALD